MDPARKALCSPVGDGFTCTFEYLDLRPCAWERHG